MTLKLQYDAGNHNYAYACFACRKSFKRPLVGLQRPFFRANEDSKAFHSENHRFMLGFRHKCSDCGRRTHFMGADFSAPKKADIKTWRDVERFIMAGGVFRGRSTRDILSSMPHARQTC